MTSPFLPEISSEDHDSVLDSPSSRPSSYPPDISPEETPSAPYSAPSDSPSEYPSILPVPYLTTLFQKAPQKAQIALFVVANSLTYEPVYAILHLDSPKMLQQEAYSTYTSGIPDSNE